MCQSRFVRFVKSYLYIFLIKNPYQISVDSGIVAVSYSLDFFQPAAINESVVNVWSVWNIDVDVDASAASSAEMPTLSLSEQPTATVAISSDMSVSTRSFDMSRL